MKFKKFKFKKVKSTNNTAIRIIKNLNCKYGMVVSDVQSMGRGQFGKKWISYQGNLFVSFFYELENINLSISKLTKINCLLVKKLLTNYYKKNITIKKPNDLLINKKKISGILQEIVSISNKKFIMVLLCDGESLNDPKLLGISDIEGKWVKFIWTQYDLPEIVKNLCDPNIYSIL